MSEYSIDLPVPSRALALAAHPDDIEFGCGATLSKWARAGCVITHVICTDGSKGTWDANADIGALIALRREEQRQASIALGGTGDVVFLGRVDGELESDLVARAAVARAIRQARPDVVLGHDPWKRYRLHPDHRHAGLLCIEGVVAARDPHFFRDQLTGGLAIHRPRAVLLFEADEVDHVETVSEGDLIRRCEALAAHRSQWETTHFYGVESADPMEGFLARERTTLEMAGQLVGAPLGEAFKLLDQL